MDPGVEGERRVSGRDFLAEILARKAIENHRRIRHGALLRPDSSAIVDRRTSAVAALRRGDGDVRFITEIKFASPSAGKIRERDVGSVESIAEQYVAAGAAAVSVLADRPGFSGTPLDVRRATRAVAAPVLFKEFVLDEVQVDLARRVGASMVLLLVRALPRARLVEMISFIRERGMEPVVEAADEAELDIALTTDATIVGVNARDLRTFRVDPELAARSMERIPSHCVAVFMSGIKDRADVDRVRATRADAVLVGEGLMRSSAPGDKLRELRGIS